jgi:DNA-binding beta-propeller fold protein YncE
MRPLLLLFVILIDLAGCAIGQSPTPPLRLVQTIELPGIAEGHHTDHLGIDVKGHRLFAPTGDARQVVVIDLESGKIIHSIPLSNPHSVVYREDVNRIYVTDDDPSAPGLKVFDGKDYRLIETVRLLKRTDSMGYDPESHLAYVVNGGRAVGAEFSILSVVDTTGGTRVGEIRIPSKTLEDMYVAQSSPRIYIALMAENQVAVVDRDKRAVTSIWQVQHGVPVATAVDEAHHRLFVATRVGQLHGNVVVLDSDTGKEITTLPVGGLVDYLAFDPQRERIYVVCSTASVYVFHEHDKDAFELLGAPETALLARTGLLVPELDRFYVLSPNTGLTPAQVFVFQIR